VLRHVAIQRLRGNDKYPLVLMLEPLFRCNLACAGCGKIQHPSEILRKHLSPSQCLKAVDECGAPIVAIPGGEPLLHPQIGEIIEGIVARKKYLYVCTNAIKLEEMLPHLKPSKYLAFSIHLDGLQKEHDASVCRDGVYDIAINAIRAARKAGFRVTTNSTLFADAEPERCSQFFDEVMQLGVEGMMVSPGYSYEKAPEQDIFLSREKSHGLFRKIFKGGGSRWKFNQSPVFLEFLKGNWDLECRPWGTPSYSLFGWQKPCYLLDEGYAETFSDLMKTTDWGSYGRASGNPKCQQCMAHCGYEPAAVEATFGSWKGFFRTARLALFGPPATDQGETVLTPPERLRKVTLPVLPIIDSV